MRILVDARHLNTPHLTGIGRYTLELLQAISKIKHPHTFTLLITGKQNWFKKYLQTLEASDAFKTLHINKSNRIIQSRVAIFKHPTINWYLKDPIDCIFLPNLSICALPADIPTILTIHDMSFEIYPECFSQKMKLWHKLAKPSTLISQASHIITPSNSTKKDVVHFTGKNENKISTIPHGVSRDFSPVMQARDHGVQIGRAHV